MDAELTPEQDEIRRTLRGLLAKHCGSEALRAAIAAPSGLDAELWHRLVELGLPGLLLPTERGGLGLGPIELAVVAEETGRALLPSPLLGTLLGGQLLADSPWAERLASGAATAALALAGTVLGLPSVPPPGGGHTGGLQARPSPSDPGGWLLYGEAPTVLDGLCADVLVVAAHAGGYPRSRAVLLAVDSSDPAVRRVRLPALDDTRSLAAVQFRDAPAGLLADPAPDLSPLASLAAVAVAAQALGAGAESLARTVTHVTTRHQFGRPLATFQSLAHALADVHVAITAARSTTLHAAWALASAGLSPTPPLPETRGVPLDPRARSASLGARGTARVTLQTAAGGNGDWAATPSPFRSAAGSGVTRAVPRAPEELASLALAAALDAQKLAAATAIQAHGGLGITWEHDAQLFYKRAAADELLFGPPHTLRALAADAVGLFKEASDA